MGAARPAAPVYPTPVETMAHRLKTPEGRRALRAAQADAGARVRHHQIRARIQAIFHARYGKTRGEWSPVTMTWNLKRIFTLRYAA
jgi:hypothetical protein